MIIASLTNLFIWTLILKPKKIKMDKLTRFFSIKKKKRQIKEKFNNVVPVQRSKSFCTFDLSSIKSISSIDSEEIKTSRSRLDFSYSDLSLEIDEILNSTSNESSSSLSPIISIQ